MNMAQYENVRLQFQDYITKTYEPGWIVEKVDAEIPAPDFLPERPSHVVKIEEFWVLSVSRRVWVDEHPMPVSLGGRIPGHWENQTAKLKVPMKHLTIMVPA